MTPTVAAGKVAKLPGQGAKDMMCKTVSAVALMACICAPAFAGELEQKVATHLIPPNAEIHVSWTSRGTDPQGRAVDVACGEVTVRNDSGFATSAFAYVVDDDKLWLSWQTEWMRQPEPLGVRSVMRYCPRR